MIAPTNAPKAARIVYRTRASLGEILRHIRSSLTPGATTPNLCTRLQVSLIARLDDLPPGASDPISSNERNIEDEEVIMGSATVLELQAPNDADRGKPTL